MNLLVELVWAAFAGFVAALVMTVVELPLWKKWGMEGVAEWQVNWVMVSQMRKEWKQRPRPILSWTLASHISHGVAAGMVFRLLLQLFFLIITLPVPSVVWFGVLYGVALWFLFTVLGRRTYESVGKIIITNRGLLGALLSDAVYGLVLGLLVWVGSYSSLMKL
jgi:hypothetical protein